MSEQQKPNWMRWVALWALVLPILTAAFQEFWQKYEGWQRDFPAPVYEEEKQEGSQQEDANKLDDPLRNPQGGSTFDNVPYSEVEKDFNNNK